MMHPLSSSVLGPNGPSSGYWELMASEMQASTTKVPYAFTRIVFLKSWVMSSSAGSVNPSPRRRDYGLTAQLSIILFDHFLDGAIAAKWTPPNRLPLGMSLSASSQADLTTSTSEISVWK